MRLPGGWQKRREGFEVWSARLLGPYLKANGNITRKLEGERQRDAEDGGSADLSGRPKSRGVKRLISFVQHDVGATTLRVPGPCTAWDAAKSVRVTCASNVERNQTDTSKRSLSFLGIAAGG